MHTTAPHAGQAGASGTDSPAPYVAPPHVAELDSAALKAVSDISHSRRLSAEEREDHIRDCTRLMEEAYQRYERDGFISDRGDADYWMHLRDEAIRGRSAAQVARLERERGLA